jgi:membrane associated rhomboid family serine protease
VVLPIGDAPNPRGVPVVTYLLIAANVAVFVLVSVPLSAARPSLGDPALAEYLRVMSHALHGRIPLAVLAQQVSAYDLFIFTHGFRPAEPTLRALLLSLFLHAGFLHLAGNMLFLWIYGDNVERRLGPVRYLAAYLGTGVVATLSHWAGAPGSDIPVVGASGAISGVLGFYFVWFPHNVVRLLWLLPPFIGQVVEVPARVVLGFYLVIDNVLPYLLAGAEGGVAHAAHIGGFIAGVALAWIGDRTAVSSRRAVYDGDGTAGDDVAALVDEGRFADAAATYLGRAGRGSRGTLPPARALALAEWLRREGHPEAAVVALRRIVREADAGPVLAAAHVALGRILLEDLDQPTPAYQHFVAALDAGGSSDATAAARAGLAAIAVRQKRQVGRPRGPA